MVKRGEGAPEDTDLRLAFRWAIVPANAGEEPPAELKAAYDWITTSDRPLGDLADPEVFEDVLYRVSYKLDGTPTFLIDGNKIDAVGWPEVEADLKAALAKAGA